MHSISCVHCGLKNWLEDGVCKRCGHPLAFIEEVRLSGSDGREADTDTVAAPGEEQLTTCPFCGARSRGVLCPVCRKQLKPLSTDGAAERRWFQDFLLSANGIVTGMLVVALLATGVAYGISRKRANAALDARHRISEAIRSAQGFVDPVSVPFSDSASELAPGVRLLMEKGLVSYRLGTLPRTVHVEETDKETGETKRVEKENPDGGKSYAHVELTARGVAASSAWHRVEADDQAAGWKVPIGSRELLDVIEIRAPQAMSRDEYDRLPSSVRRSFQASDQLVPVIFTWRWKPDELGNYFDVNSEDHRGVSAASQESARAFYFNDSAKTQTGKAFIVYSNGEPTVKAVVYEH